MAWIPLIIHAIGAGVTLKLADDLIVKPNTKKRRKK
jgi:hypothetical protein